MSINVALRSARSQDMAACAAILNDWIDETDWMPRVHAHQTVVDHYKNVVLNERKTLVAVADGTVLGFVTLAADGFVTALYVAREHRNRGIGGLLLTRAKRDLGDGVRLYSFDANAVARAFYGKHGFVEINRTSGDNEEGLPDVLLEWRQ